jgi:hypothetical protein
MKRIEFIRDAKWNRVYIHVTANIRIGLGIVFDMRKVPRKLWCFSRTVAWSRSGIGGDATTVSLWRIRLGFWKAWQ